jgi:hypothetical protein
MHYIHVEENVGTDLKFSKACMLHWQSKRDLRAHQQDWCVISLTHVYLLKIYASGGLRLRANGRDSNLRLTYLGISLIKPDKPCQYFVNSLQIYPRSIRMGVKYLWHSLNKANLIQEWNGKDPTDLPIIAAEMEGKVLAIDLSIWSMQAGEQLALIPLCNQVEAAAKVAFERVSRYLFSINLLD